MRMRNVEIEDINFTGGINGWNLMAERGTLPVVGSAYLQSHPMYRKEHLEGFVDDIVNLDFMPDGSLIQRNRVFPHPLTNGDYPTAVPTARQQFLLTKEPQNVSGQRMGLLGFYLSGTLRILTTNDSSILASLSSYSFSGGTQPMVAVYYNDKWYLYHRKPDSLTSGDIGYSVDSAGNVVGPFTPGFVNLPGFSNDYLLEAFIWKDRVWGRTSNGAETSSIVSYSASTDPTKWSAADGGGYFQLPTKGTIIDLIVHQDELYILDAAGNLWNFTYYDDPGAGTLRQIIDAGMFGPITDNTNHLAVSGANLYLASSTNVYLIVNDQAFPIADQLHLELNGYDSVKIFDLGYGLLVTVYYYGSEVTTLNFVYHHNVKAWTRYTFELFADAIDTGQYYLDQAHVYSTSYSNQLCMIFSGSNTYAEYFPIMDLVLETGFFGEHANDSYLDLLDGTSAADYRRPEIKIKTGPIYAGLKHEFKRFYEFLLEGYLGQRNDDVNTNYTPWKSTVDFIPASIADDTDSTHQISSEDDPTEATYRIPMYQRARGAQLTFELEDRTEEETQSSTNMSAKAYFSALRLLFRPARSHRGKSSATLTSDGSTI